MIDKKKLPTNGIFKLLSFNFLFKYVHCDMRFLFEKNSALLWFLDVFGIAVPVFTY